MRPTLYFFFFVLLGRRDANFDFHIVRNVMHPHATSAMALKTLLMTHRTHIGQVHS